MEVAASLLEVTGDEREPPPALARRTLLFASGKFSGKGSLRSLKTRTKRCG